MTNAAQRPRLFVLNDPHAMRISPELANEIGLNESIVLLQVEFLMRLNTEERDGKQWIYHPLEYWHEEHFIWWSVTTIGRIFKSLEKMGLIFINGKYNKLGYDRTQWVALNYEGLAKLSSIKVSGDTDAIYQNDKSIVQIDKSIYQNDTAIYQSEPTIQEDYKKTIDKSEGKESARPLSELALAIADVCKINPKIPTDKQKRALNATYQALKGIGATPSDVRARETWWYANAWQAKKEGRAPRPDELQAIWDEAATPVRKQSTNGAHAPADLPLVTAAPQQTPEDRRDAAARRKAIYEESKLAGK